MRPTSARAAVSCSGKHDRNAARSQAWRVSLLAAELDFSDEGDVEGPLVERALQRAAGVLAGLRDAQRGFAHGERVREGFVVVLAGPPNAGKSSLLNALARREVAIVSPVAGTTRDAIEVRLDLDGLPVTLIDTAGLRDSDDAIEAEGVRRARDLAAKADLVLSLRAIDSDADRDHPGGSVIALATKADLGGTARPGELRISARSGEGMPQLLALLVRRLAGEEQPEPALLTRERHRVAIAEAVVALERILASPGAPAELLAEDLRLAVRALERLLGRVDVEDVLDQLFAGFCIGTVLASYGYDGDALEQTPLALQGILLAISLLPALGHFLLIPIVFFYRLSTQRCNEIRQELDVLSAQ